MTLSQNPKRFLILSSVVVGIAMSACATEPKRQGPSPDRQGEKRPPRSSGTFLHPIAVLMTDMDINKDKVVDRSELNSGIQREWDGFDRNPSAIDFSRWSITALGSTDALPNFMNFDQDFNGVVTESEFSNQLESEFNRLDKNKDGRLERQEMIVSFQAQRGQSNGTGGQGRPQRGQRGGGGGQRQR